MQNLTSQQVLPEFRFIDFQTGIAHCILLLIGGAACMKFLSNYINQKSKFN
jgi:hypothetical protein